jgi:DNA-binding NarL/FixJ family response regulator
MIDRDMRAKPKITVVIVDDHPLFLDGLQRTLAMEADIEVVGQSNNGEDALRIIRRLQPDVVLLDVNLPVINGLQVARQLRAERPDIAVIVLTAYHDVEQVVHAMRAGASAYCSKDVQPAELIAIVRDTVHGLYVVGDRRLDERALEHWIQSNISSIGGPYMIDGEEHFVPLSPRELEILQFVTNGLSNKEIALKLRISQQTVKNHMTSILKKLNVEDRTQAAVNALRRGWVRLEGNNQS